MTNNFFIKSENEFKVIFDVFNENYFYVKVIAPTIEHYNQVIACLNTSFEIFDPNAKHTWQYKNGLYDGRIRFFNKKNNTLDIGLAFRAYNFLKMGVNGIEIEFTKKLSDFFVRPSGILSRKEVEDFFKSLNLYNKKYNYEIIPYEHQYKIFECGINYCRCSMVACTGSGKSLAQYAMVRWLNDIEKIKVLIIVPSSGLVEQMYNDFKYEYGWDNIDDKCSLIYSNSKDKLTEKEKDMLKQLNLTEDVKLKDVTISTWQSLLRKPSNFFLSFGAVIVDEAHGAKADELRRILNQCVNAKWKLGLSGTIPDTGLDAILIEGCLGKREEIVRAYELIQKNILSPIEIHSIIIPYDNEQKSFICRQDYKSECVLFSNNGSRQKILSLLFNAKKITENENTLILFRNKDAINIMKTFLEKYYPKYKIYVIQGEVKAKIREEYRNNIENTTGNIILATYGTMKQGVNIRLLHNLVFAQFSKSMYEVIQSIGRILRKHKDKNLARVFDIVDNASYITKNGLGSVRKNKAMVHYDIRKSYYFNEGYRVFEFTAPYIEKVDPVYLEKKETISKSFKNKKFNKVIKGKGNMSQFLL